jgi:signal transduction histidine kinase/ActR/RegA family two-component response regulator
MFDFVSRLFDTNGFPPRWSCGTTWQQEPSLGWLHILSDLAIFGAYTAIPLVIAFFVLRRRDLPFPRVFWLFVIFIFACNTTHLIGAILFWNPLYRLDGLVKLVTAMASWATVAALVVATPQALRLPGLAKLNDELRSEVEERKQTESALRQSEQRLQENEDRLRQALAERETLLANERDARGEAERANRLKDEFLSVVSHELRTPLSAILAHSQLLQLGQIPSDEVADSYRAIERNSKAQVQIIEDLLDMSRIISGKIRLDVRSVLLSEIVEAAIDTIRPAADAKTIRVQQVLDPRAGPVLGDFDRLQQVFRNILSNAVKFTPKGGRIQVALERVNSHVEVSVADTGAGISADFLPYVFDRFRQAEHATTRHHGGLGLGLAIVKQIVELHGGAVKAKSPGENQGSTFIVILPLQVVHGTESDRIHPQAEVGPAQSDQIPSLAGVKVLVVDDEADARDIVRRFLKARNATVMVASSADEALENMRTFRPDVLLSDIGMPGKDGYQFIQAVRTMAADDGAQVPAVALTAFVRTEDRRRALLAGYQSHLAKPVDPGELIAVVAMLAGRISNNAENIAPLGPSAD